MSKKPNLRPMTREDAQEALRKAIECLDDTDGCPICLLVVRNGDLGPEMFSPTIPPEMMPTEVIAGFARAYADFLDSGRAQSVADAPEGKPQFVELGIQLRKPKLQPMRGKYTVN